MRRATGLARLALISSLVVAAGGATAVSTAPSAAAQDLGGPPDGNCTVTAHLPAKVSLTSSSVRYRVPLSGCEVGADNFLVSATLLKGHDQYSYLSWSSSDSIDDLVLNFFKPGTYKAVLDYSDITVPATCILDDGYTFACEKDYLVTLASGSMVVKNASRIALTTSRKRDHVTLRVTAKHFDSFDYAAAPPRTTIYVQRQSHGQWRTIKVAHTGTTGKATITLTNKNHASYRVQYAETSNTWSSTSNIRRQ